MKKTIFIVLLAVVLVSYNFYRVVTKQGPLTESSSILIEKGSTLKRVIRDMHSQGIIEEPMIFEVIARLKNVDKKIKSGEYMFPARISIVEALEKLISGEVFYRKITLPEGQTTRQYLDIINASEYLIGEVTIDVSEGEMLPETYSISRGDSRNSVVIQAKEAMEKTLDKAWSKGKRYTNLESKREVLILASIIEKETAVPSERRTVASVFVNRLDIGMKLQTDPTVIYALTNGERDLGRSLKKADMKVDSPYNTYRYKGLPPGPICNPSKESIEAALDPEDTDYLFFVADGKGGHSFSHNYNDHKKRIKDWMSNLKSSQKL